MGANRISGFQQITPETFRVFPHRVDRLIPWIRRDLRAILSISCTQEGDFPHGQTQHLEQDSRLYKYEEIGTGMELIREFIIAVLKKYDLQTDQGQDLLQDFLQEHTEHFVHELIAFARSSLSIAAYDEVAQYDMGQSPPASVASGRSSSDPSTTAGCDARRVQQRHDRRSTDSSAMRLGDIASDNTSKLRSADTVPTIGKRFSRQGAYVSDARKLVYRGIVGVQDKTAERRASSSSGKLKSDKIHSVYSRVGPSMPPSIARRSSDLADTTVQETELPLERSYSTQSNIMSAILQAKLKRERELYDNSRR